MPFDLIVLSEQRKFLSRATLATPQDTANRVLLLLANQVVGSVSIKRTKPKPQPDAVAD